MATHDRACNENVRSCPPRIFAAFVVALAFAGIGCTESHARSTPTDDLVAVNVAPAKACACGQYSPLYCDSLAKMCATDPADPDCEDRDVACACAQADDHGACN